ncbi:MAG: hypothetical protein PHQ95_02410 [Candidatus Gracilibacteria bacterium]|nr:hypothetical protein [Candidatus Gracilibacteria bacterium]
MNLHNFKKSIYSALVFFGTLMMLSIGYAAFLTINSSEYIGGTPLTSTLFGKVVDNLSDLNTRLSNAETNGGIVPTGAIMAFNLTACPTGWTEYTAARGRFLRGFDNGAGNDPDCAIRTGGCTVGSTQGDELKSHAHSLSEVWDNSPQTSASPQPPTGYPIASDGANTGISGESNITPTGGTETRPKNVMVLFCSKN